MIDRKMSIGNLITIIVVAVSALASYFLMYSQVGNHTRVLSQHDARLIAQERRIHQMELVGAGQASDLRNIQSGITRIESALDRISRGGAGP